MWAVALGVPLAFDAWLVRTGQPSLSSHARRHPAVTAGALAYFTLHLLGRPAALRRLDPLSAAGRRIRKD